MNTTRTSTDASASSSVPAPGRARAWPARLGRPALAAAALAVAAIAASLAASPMANAAGNAGAAATSLKPFEPQSVEQIAASHKGKPFVILVWSMDCEFCQHSLDVLSRARAANPGFDIVTISTDPLSDAALSQLVTKRLSGINLLADAWSFGEQPPERLRYAIDPRWRGEKPRSYWYDAQGQRSAHSGVITPAVIEKMR